MVIRMNLVPALICAPAVLPETPLQISDMDPPQEYGRELPKQTPAAGEAVRVFLAGEKE